MLDFNILLDEYIKNIEPENLELAEYFQAYLHIVETYGYGSDIKPGRLQLLGWDIDYRSLGATIPNFIDQILIRRLNDFNPDNDHPVIFDCGANIGFSSLAYKRRFPNAKIIAFEPDPEIVPLLRQNLERNGAGDIKVVDAAVWVENGIAQWRLEGIDGSRLQPEGLGDVKVRTIDFTEYLDQTIDLIKLDIEGAEYEVIRHIQPKLKNVKEISIECHIDQKSILYFGDMLKTLKESGFELSINSFGAWRDLIRQPETREDHHEGYLLVSAWRKLFAADSYRASWIPSAGIAPLLDYANQLRYVLSQVVTLKAAFDVREAELLGYLGAFAVSKGKLLKSSVLKTRFQNEGGLCWKVSLAGLKDIADNESQPTRSTLLLFEGIKPLLNAHSLHDEIRTLGAGRYSHWNDTLYFSTSDGSDPNNNAREYRIVYLS